MRRFANHMQKHFMPKQYARKLLREELLENLLVWQNETPEEKGRVTAVHDILDVFDNQYTNLHLSHLGLSSLPPCLDKLLFITDLTLNNNNFTIVPETIFNLSNLTHLDLSHNKLLMLNDRIGQLLELSELILNHNAIRVLPKSMVELQKLWLLNVEYNNLDLPPHDLKKSDAEIYISGNYLNDEPYHIEHSDDSSTAFLHMFRNSVRCEGSNAYIIKLLAHPQRHILTAEYVNEVYRKYDKIPNPIISKILDLTEKIHTSLTPHDLDESEISLIEHKAILWISRNYDAIKQSSTLWSSTKHGVGGEKGEIKASAITLTNLEEVKISDNQEINRMIQGLIYEAFYSLNKSRNTPRPPIYPTEKRVEEPVDMNIGGNPASLGSKMDEISTPLKTGVERRLFSPEKSINKSKVVPHERVKRTDKKPLHHRHCIRVLPESNEQTFAQEEITEHTFYELGMDIMRFREAQANIARGTPRVTRKEPLEHGFFKREKTSHKSPRIMPLSSTKDWRSQTLASHKLEDIARVTL